MGGLGFIVISIDDRRAAREAAAHLIRFGHTRNIIVSSLDVTDDSMIASAIEQTVARFGAIDVLLKQ